MVSLTKEWDDAFGVLFCILVVLRATTAPIRLMPLKAGDGDLSMCAGVEGVRSSLIPGSLTTDPDTSLSSGLSNCKKRKTWIRKYTIQRNIEL